MVVRMRRNHSQTAKRRSHHALKGKAVRADKSGNLHLSHRVNPVTGLYKGRVIIDVVAIQKRAERRTKRKDRELRESGQETTTSEEAKT